MSALRSSGALEDAWRRSAQPLGSPSSRLGSLPQMRRRRFNTISSRNSSSFIQRDLSAFVRQVNQPKRIPLSVVLAVFMVSQLILAVGLNWYIVWSSGRDALETMSDRVMEANLERLKSTSLSLLDEAASTDSSTLINYQTEGLRPNDTLGQRRHFWGQLSARPHLSFVYFGREDNGKFLGYGRSSDGSSIAYLQHDDFASATNASRVRYTTDDVGDPVSEISRSVYDARLRPWYVEAREAGTPIWTSVYPFASTPELGVTAAAPYYDDEGTLVGVASVDLLLNSLNMYLQEQDFGDTAVPVILEPDGWIVATGLPLNISGAKINILDTEVEELRQIGDWLVKRYGSIANVPNVTHSHDSFAGVGGTTFIATTAILAFRSWHFVESCSHEYFATIDRGNRINGGVAAAMLFLSTVLAVIVAWVVVRPLRAIQNDMQEVTRKLSFGGTEHAPQRMRELAEIQDSYMALKKGLQNFLKYVPTEVVKQLVLRQGTAVLAVEHVDATVFFSDIADFTTLSERVSPSLLIMLLEQYLDAMADVIIDGQGTVGDYIGDAVLAFWGGPLMPVDNHIISACECAIRQQERIMQLNAIWAAEDLPQFTVRMGLHQGRLLCGNVGSKRRLKYTVIGDVVNLASRLENLNKMYGTLILVSEEVVLEAEDYYLFRPLDVVAVKGRNMSTRIYELVCRRHDATPHQVEVVDLATEALDLYLGRQFAECVALLDVGLERLTPDDAAWKMLRASCVKFMHKPPPMSWNGTRKMKVKG